MRWLKVAPAMKEWAGNISAKTAYRAIRSGALSAARVGAGRNYLLCEEFIDTWLRGRLTHGRPSSRERQEGSPTRATPPRAMGD
jgi:excisionase family DNA binding protein